MQPQIFSPQFHPDGGTDLLSTAVEYARSLREECSVLKNPSTGRFHIIRQYDVSRRVREMNWILYATITVITSVEYHLPSEQL